MASYKNGSITLENVYGKKTYETTIAECGSSIELQELTITQNGTYTAPEDVGYSPVNVNVPSKEEETKSITITENGTTTVLPTSGKTLSKVDIVANVPQTAESGTLKYLLDATKSARYLFAYYQGTSIDGFISYSDTSSVTSMSSMFYSCSNLTTILQLDTSSCTNMREMFSSCTNLTIIPQLDTSKVTDMYQMFYYCKNLTTIPLLNTSSCINMKEMFNSCNNLITIPQLDTSKVTDMTYMFLACHNLITIPTLSTSQATNMSGMFYECNKLQTIDITRMNITSTSYSKNFAYHCYSLTKLIIRNMDTIPTLASGAFAGCYHFYGITDATYNPEGLKDGRIYVPDDKVDALKTATNWSVFADIIVPLSTLVEE